MIAKAPSGARFGAWLSGSKPQPAEKRFNRCVLHIGSEKTGTSTIQSFLARNRVALAREGVAYTNSAGNDGGSQWGFVACAHHKPWTQDFGLSLGIRSAADRDTYKARLRADLEGEFQTVPAAKTLIVSSEHFHSRLSTPAEVSSLKEFLDPWIESFEILLYLRRQDRVAVSFYSTKIKSGESNPVVFPLGPKGANLYYFDYDRICDTWSTVFGADAMRIRLYDRQELVKGDLLADFCKTCGLRRSGKKVTAPLNLSLSQEGADFLLEVNRQMPRSSGGRQNELRARLAEFIAGICQGRIACAQRSDAMAFLQRFAEGNERLRDRFFPWRTAPLFDMDFSDYPERLTQLAPRYESAVRLAVTMWCAHANANSWPAVTAPELPVCPVPASPAPARPAPDVERKIIRLEADNHYLLGLLALRSGRRDRAIEQFRNSLEVNAGHFRANIELAKTLLKDGDLEQGIKYLRAARAVHPRSNAALDALYEQYADHL
jgi:hypothetical protein